MFTDPRVLRSVLMHRWAREGAGAQALVSRMASMMLLLVCLCDECWRGHTHRFTSDKKRLDKGQPVTGGTCDTYKPVCALHRRVVSGLLIFVMSKPIHNWPQ